MRVENPGSDNTNASAVFIRYIDSNNYYQCNVNASDGYVIFKKYQGNFSVLQNISASPGPGNHLISCSVSGSTITLTVDGIQRVQVTDSDLQNTGRGGIQLVPNITTDDYSSVDDSSPTPTPTVSPTLTPTPTPSTSSFAEYHQ